MVLPLLYILAHEHLSPFCLWYKPSLGLIWAVTIPQLLSLKLMPSLSSSSLMVPSFRRNWSHMEGPCADAPINSSSWAQTWSYSNPGTRYGSKETSGWFQPQPFKALPAIGNFPTEFADIVEQREANSTVPSLICWATESVSKIKQLFYATKSGVVCNTTVDTWNTSPQDSGILEGGETFSHHCIPNLYYGGHERGSHQLSAKCKWKAECLLPFAFWAFFNVQLSKVHGILEI